jgi:hypothetical protein
LKRRSPNLAGTPIQPSRARGARGRVRIEAIDDFVEAYNPKAAPFEWKKAVVFPSDPQGKVR